MMLSNAGGTDISFDIFSNPVTWLLQYSVHLLGGDKKGFIFSADNRLSTAKNKRKVLSEILSADIIGACVFLMIKSD